MSLTINHNLMAGSAARNLSTHYVELGTSVRRLSSGLRVGTAADDAAGLAVRELMRSDIRSINQGIRNANDAVSMIQTADGALQVIDEKLIRLKELATQAATGTYNADQRQIIDSEFQAMKAEIDRIAKATDFNGIYLLKGGISSEYLVPEYLSDDFMHFTFNGTYTGEHGEVSSPLTTASFTGSGPEGSSAVRVVNNSVSLPEVDWTTFGNEATLSIWVNEENIVSPFQNSYVTFNGGFVHMHRDGGNLQYKIGNNTLTVPFDNADRGQWVQHTMVLDADHFSAYQNGELVAQTSTVTPVGTPAVLRPTENAIARNYWSHSPTDRRQAARTTGSFDDLRFYTKALDEEGVEQLNNYTPEGDHEFATEEQDLLVHFGPGNDSAEDYYGVGIGSATTDSLGISSTGVNTQERAQNALEVIDDAMIKKDKIRAHLGAMQNRLENTITNLSIQAENLQASESRISDVDVATEMTEFVRRQILTQSATAMLAQANSLPKMAMQLIGG